MAPKRMPSIHKKSQSPMKQSVLSFKATKRSVSKAKAKAKGKAPVRPTHSESRSESEEERKPITLEDSGSEDDLPVNEEELDMLDKAGNYKGYHKEAKEKMGWIRPCELPFPPIQLLQNQTNHAVHADGQTTIHHMLRVFDNTYEYGPCVGMTRMERWERAAAMGLNPPVEVCKCLLGHRLPGI